jgi:hypothetical protein
MLTRRFKYAHVRTRRREGKGRHPMTSSLSQQPRNTHTATSLPYLIGTCCLSRTWPTLNPVIHPILEHLESLSTRASTSPLRLLIATIESMH